MTRFIGGVEADHGYLVLPLHVRFRAVCILTALALIVVLIGPFVLDPYTQSVLVRAFLLAVTALTVDLLWGTTGILSATQQGQYCLPCWRQLPYLCWLLPL